jgi:SAM-dependent methyltransferase
VNPGKSWDERYQGNNRIWGEDPSELAVITVEYLQTVGLSDGDLRILDIGCGYGRDALYLSKRLKCSVLGIDISQEAIKMARGACPEESRAEFRCCDFAEAVGGEYDVVFVSNLYHLIRRDERQRLREAVAGLLKPGGLLFLGALSTNDRQDYGKGTPMPDEPGSFEGKRYRHFCTRDELLEDFSFLTIRQLYEHEYDEPHTSSETHHHISWIVVGERDAHLR